MVPWLAAANFQQQMLCRLLDLQRLSDVVYSLEGYLLPTVEETEDLGVNVDSRLKFSQHVSKLAAKGHSLANLILKYFPSRDIDSLVTSFYNVCSTTARILFSCLESDLQERH